jgi:hypothetical protein
MKMKKGGEGETPVGVLVISFGVRRKETEAYVNNLAKLSKGLYIIDHRIRNVITQAEKKKKKKKKKSDELGAVCHCQHSSLDC